MKKLVILAALSVICIKQSMAQVRFGPELGLNLSSISFKGEDESETSDMKVGFRVGGVADIGITSHLYIQPGIFYSVLGGKQEDVTENISYIQVPVHINYKLGEAGGGRFFFGLTPYFGYAISGKIKVGDEDVDLNIGSDEAEDDLKALDFGIGINLGYEMPMGLFFRGQYGFGLANYALGDGEEQRNRNIAITAGWLFGGRR
jgi:hypothetical protein